MILPKFTIQQYLNPQPVEPSIKELARPLEATCIVRVLNSCQGNFDLDDPTRQSAYVHFKKTSWASMQDLQFILQYLASFANPSRLNVLISVGTLYTPWGNEPIFGITITPLCSTNAPAALKRKLNDAGVSAATELLWKAMEGGAKKHFKMARRHFKRMAKQIKKAVSKYCGCDKTNT